MTTNATHCRFRDHITPILIAFGIVLALVIPAGMTSPTRAQAAPLKVVATFSVLDDMVRNVGGDKVELVTIVPAGGDAHAFDPNPDQVASIADADIIFEIGAGFETWLDDMVAASGSGATRVVTSDGIELLASDPDHHHDDQAEGADEDGHDHAEGETDPHIWHDVANGIVMTGHIRDALVAADPAQAATYNANADASIARLNDLDTFVRGEVAKLPQERRKLVTTHDTFGYYAQAYGFEIVGTALRSVTTESADPSAQEIVALAEDIADAGVPAIFADNVSNPDLMQTIADDAGVELAPPLYSDALGESGSPGGTYIDMIRYNTVTIVTALSG